MKTLLKLFLLILILFSTSCTHETIVKPIYTDTGSIIVDPPSPTVKSDTVCFNTEILPLYTTYCSSPGCHDAISHREGVTLTNYAQIKNGITAKDPSRSPFYTIIGNGMPPRNSPQMTTDQLATIVKWINQGALNTNCINSCDTTKFTYTNAIQGLLLTNCNGCHGSNPGSGNVYLGDYASAKTYISANQALFLNAITHSTSLTPAQRMPPSNKMADCQISQFEKWINAGYPQ